MWMELLQTPDEWASQTALVADSLAHTWSELLAASQQHVADLASLAGERVGFPFDASAGGLAILAALDELACDVFLMDAQADVATWRQWSTDLQLAALVTAPSSGVAADPGLVERLANPAAGSGGSTVTILTSGTTGRPKAARHTWTSLLGPVRRNPTGVGPRWLLTYRPHLYAGLQVLLQCLSNHGALVLPRPDAGPDELAQTMARHQVACVSATPSYWRRLILFANRQQLAQAPLRQITLGGELVDQTILDTLQQTFPQARIVHIYATTELGRCFSVIDARAGFPADYLDQTLEGGILLQIRDGVLWVRPAHGMQTYDPIAATATTGIQSEEGWYCTGDRVEVRADRVYFLGRDSDIINVGGNKVAPTEVERVLRDVPGVADVRVFAASSSLAGQLVACEIVPQEGTDEGVLRAAINVICREKLAAYQRPRVIRFVSAIEITSAGKTARR